MLRNREARNETSRKDSTQNGLTNRAAANRSMHIYEVRPREDYRGFHMKRYSLRFTLRGMVIALAILTSCAAQTTHSTRVSEVKDRHNLRDEQEDAPRVDNVSIDR